MPELPARGQQRSLLTTYSFYFFQGLKLPPILPNKNLKMRVFLVIHARIRNPTYGETPTPKSKPGSNPWSATSWQSAPFLNLGTGGCRACLYDPEYQARVRCRGFRGRRGGRVRLCSCKANSNCWKQARREEPPRGLRAVTGGGPQGPGAREAD